MQSEQNTTRGRPAKYPWGRWLNGRRRTLVKGVDFDCEAYALVLQLRRKAALMDKRVVAKISGDTITFRAERKLCPC